MKQLVIKQLEFLTSVSGSTHVNLSQVQSRTSQNTVLIKENCLDELKRDIIAGQEVKLRTIHLSTVRPSAEAPSAKQPDVQETGNTSQSKAHDSGAEVSMSSIHSNHLADGYGKNEAVLAWREFDNVNGKKDVSFPGQLPDMLPVHTLLFDHAVESLKEYQRQGPQEKDIILVKDAQ
ncbi:hypothetical protein BGX30_003356 [Mortierella sp. GBA39]|nr:hypothetical protein BGX30_003356 [Mortierella sp. GBA39]